MYREYIENGRLCHDRIITEDFKREIMFIPCCQQYIIDDQVETLIKLDFYIDDIKEYKRLKKNVPRNWDLLALVDIPKSYIYKLKQQKLRRY